MKTEGPETDATEKAADVRPVRKVPNLAAVYPPYQEAIARRQRIVDEKSNLTRQYAVMSHAFTKSLMSETDGPFRDEYVSTLLGDRLPENTPSLRDLGEIQKAIKKHDIAIHEMESRIRYARQDASKIIVADFRDEYRERVRKMAFALLSAREAINHYLDLVDEFNDRDVAWTVLIPMHPNFMGEVNAYYDEFGMWFNECVVNGFLNKDEVPEALFPR